MEKLLVINPGSTSTKIAYFEGNERIWQEDISHSRAELERFDDVLDQLEMRCALVKDAMAAHGVRAEELTALAARGGTIAPLRSGAYEVNDAMVDVILHRPQDRHASLLGALIARRIAGASAYYLQAFKDSGILSEGSCTAPSEETMHAMAAAARPFAAR